MPPLSTPMGFSRLSNLTISNGYTLLSKIFLVALFVATCIWVGVLCCTRRKRRILEQSQPADEKDVKCRQAASENNDKKRNACQPQRQQSGDQSPRDFKPVYPWISPPQPLPGPYDPRVYPLPTIRRHSYPNPSPENPMETNTISYTRRVSTNSVPNHESTLRGSITVSSNGTSGWRRNQWVVSAG